MSNSFILLSLRTVSVEPIEAAMIAPIEAAMIAPSASSCMGVSVSPRKIIPETAASAGSMLISVPNVRVGKRVRAIISSE